MHTNTTTVALKPNFMSSLLLYAVFPKICIMSSITLKIKNLHNIDPKSSLSSVFVLIAVFITLYHIKGVQDDISGNAIPI